MGILLELPASISTPCEHIQAAGPAQGPHGSKEGEQGRAGLSRQGQEAT